MNWFNLISAIPLIIQGVQLIHADKPGTAKKVIALQWLGLGEEVAINVAPGLAPVIQTVNTEVGKIINSVVSIFHSANVSGFGNTQQPSITSQPSTPPPDVAAAAATS